MIDPESVLAAHIADNGTGLVHGGNVYEGRVRDTGTDSRCVFVQLVTSPREKLNTGALVRHSLQVVTRYDHDDSAGGKAFCREVMEAVIASRPDGVVGLSLLDGAPMEGDPDERGRPLHLFGVQIIEEVPDA